MNDIEEAGAAPAGASGTAALAAVNPRDRRTTDGRRGADIPGDATIFVHTFGCGHNVSDGEYMAGLLAEKGYRLTDEFSNADCFLINSCTVKNPSEEHFVTMLKRARGTGKPVIVAGCVPQGEPDGKEWADVSVIGVQNIHQVNEVVQEALRGNTMRLGVEHPAGKKITREERRKSRNSKKLGEATVDSVELPRTEPVTAVSAALPSLLLPKIRRNKFIEIIPINVGCLNQCTYCKTKHARGDLKSWSIEEICQRVSMVVQEGVVREIRLTSEDVGAYGIDLGTDIIALLKAIVQVLEGTDVMLRIGMSNPPYLLKHVEAFAQLLLHPNVYEFVHIPVQSGSDAILDAMKREYTAAEFLKCVEAIRAVAKDTCIATDIICAFPGEGDAEWEETMQLCRMVRFPVVNISRFYPRRGTPAAVMTQIRTDIAKKRTVELTTLFNSYATYDGLIGTKHRITLLETAHDQHHLVGHTKCYAQVLVNPADARLGDTVEVEIVAASKYSVTGKLLRILAEPSVPSKTATASSNKRTASRGGAVNNLMRAAPLVAIALFSITVASIMMRRKVK